MGTVNYDIHQFRRNKYLNYIDVKIVHIMSNKFYFTLKYDFDGLDVVFYQIIF